MKFAASELKHSKPTGEFRSKLEAEYAEALVGAGYLIQYEPERLRLDGIYYQPDFYCVWPGSGGGMVLEVKGVFEPADAFKVVDYTRALRRTDPLLADQYVLALPASWWLYQVPSDRWSVINCSLLDTLRECA